MEKEKLVISIDEQLGDAFNYNFPDLEANRAGLMSRRQKAIRWKPIGEVLRALLFLALIYFLVMSAIEFTQKDFISRSQFFWVTLLTMGFMTLFLFWNFGVLPLLLDFLSGRVQSLMGPLQIEERSRPQKGYQQFLVVGQEEFLLPEALPEIDWNHDSSYRVYFLPRSRIILSLEEELS